MFELGLGEFSFTSAIRKEKRSLIVLFASAMVDQTLDNEINRFKDVTTGFIISKFNITEFDDFSYKIKFRLGDGMKESAVSII